MRIEEKVFQRKRIIFDKLIPYGFQKISDVYRYETVFHNNEFQAILTISPQGKAEGSVIDCMNDEEYLQLRMENFNGAYVNGIRSAYEDVLRDIAEKCCSEVYFVSDQANRIAERIRIAYGVYPDFPWGRGPHECSGTFRHRDSAKWFALIMNIRYGLLMKNQDDDFVDVINLKADQNQTEQLFRESGIYPAYHMNHKKWISVVLNDRIADERVMQLIDDSYRLTKK